MKNAAAAERPHCGGGRDAKRVAADYLQQKGLLK